MWIDQREDGLHVMLGKRPEAIEPVYSCPVNFPLVCPLCGSHWKTETMQMTVDCGPCWRARCSQDHILLVPAKREEA